VGAGSLHLLVLGGHRRNMSLVGGSRFLRCRTRRYSTVSAVVTYVIRRIVNHRGVVNVVNVGDVHVVHRTIVEKLAVVPAPALVALAEVAKAVIDPAIEADLWTPEAFMENESLSSPTPPAWGPEEADLRGQDPGSRHQVVVA